MSKRWCGRGPASSPRQMRACSAHRAPTNRAQSSRWSSPTSTSPTASTLSSASWAQRACSRELACPFVTTAAAGVLSARRGCDTLCADFRAARALTACIAPGTKGWTRVLDVSVRPVWRCKCECETGPVLRCETRATVRVAPAPRRAPLGAAGGAKMTVFPAMSSSRL